MKKSRKILLILAFILLLGLIYMPSKTLAAEDGEVVSINIGANAGSSVSSVYLYLEDHETEQLKTTIKVWKNHDIVEDDSIKANWSSSDESVVTISSTGLITAKKEGTATITATVGDKTKSIEVNVKSITFADFSDVKYEWDEDLMSGSLHLVSENAVKWYNNANSNDAIYTIVTKDNTKPEILLNKNGQVDAENTLNIQKSGVSTINGKYKGYYHSRMEKYIELNQDIYLWVISEKYLSYPSGGYYNKDGTYVLYSSRFVVSGEKIEKRPNPVYNGCFWASYISYSGIQLDLNMVGGSEYADQRNFNLKIGKVTDNGILNSIKNENADGFSQLEVYAKANTPVFEGKLTTNEEFWLGYNNENETLPLDGKLEDKEYYYIYVEFDDENGKYAPIEHCLTLGQADVYVDGWYLSPYGDDKFSWKEFSTENTGGDYTPTGTDGTIKTGKTDPDESTAPTSLPHTGISYALIVAISIFGVVGIVAYFKNNKYKGI